MATELFTGTGAGFASLTWTTIAGAFSRVSNVGTSTTSGSLAIARCESSLASADMYAQMQVVSTDGGDRSVGVWVRFAAAATTGYYLEINASDARYILYRYDAGVSTILIDYTAVEAGVDFDDGDTVKLSAETVTDGTKLTGYWADQQLFEYLDTGSVLTGVRGGIGAYNPNSALTWDVFTVDTLASLTTADRLPEALTVEVEFLPGVWTDLSDRLLGDGQVRGGRSTAYEDTAPSTLAVILSNADGALTPDNPLSEYYPRVIENIGIRYSITDPSGVVRGLFVGYIDAISPLWPSGHYSSAVVQIEASDVLARHNRFVLRSDWVQKNQQLALAGSGGAGDDWVEVWPLAGDSHADRLGNVGAGSSEHYPAELRRQKTTPWGTYSLGDSVDPLDARLDGCLTLDPSDADSSYYRRGWTVRFRTSQELTTLQFWFQIPPDMLLKASDGTAWTGLLIGSLLNGDGTVLANIKLTADGTGCFLGTGYGMTSGLGTVSSAATDGINLRDGRWHLLTARTEFDPTSEWRIDDGPWHTGATVDLFSVRTLVVGGGFATNGSEPAVSCVPMKVGPAAFTCNISEGEIGYEHADPLRQVDIYSRAAEFINYIWDHGIDTPGSTRVHADSAHLVLAAPTAGRSLGEVVQELARTIGGAWWVDLDGYTRFADGSSLRLPTPAVSVTLEEDDAGAFEWRRAVDERPTRVTASSPGGDATIIDTDAEALGARRDEVMETCALDSVAAGGAAGWRMSMAAGLRLRKVSVDLVTAANNLWPLIGVLRPFVRLRVYGLPSSQIGYTHVDVHVVGWTITASPERVLIEMDTVPAAVEAAIDTARIAAEPSTLDDDITSSATSLAIATPSGDTWTIDSAAYPMVAIIGGEGIYLPSPPSGAFAAISPQTFTGVIRGWNGTVAQSHFMGASCDLWDALTINI